MTVRSLAWAWAAWTLVTALAGAYYAAGRLASRPVSVPLLLTPGQVVQAEVGSVLGHHLVMGLQSERVPRHLDLQPVAGGAPSVPGDGRTHRLQSPAAAVQVEVSVQSRRRAEPVPGPTPNVPAGRSSVTLKVTEVAPGLRGETVRLLVQAPVTFKTTQAGYHWLWFYWLALPVFVLSQYVWALVLVVKSQRRRTAAAVPLSQAYS
ncbi:hypothetical protein OOT46_19325 [Aquabacterium sp. A7-Y]|uniref:hypothetical protein n=1 Tax=Aquabacterium sp. A7-Y TaxID=1349605 RepID=UPI00223DE6DA|nr:hypothetical protein [Aquabacterium sp. A7-Y]MCW7539992.1 hypothetical protein [Aquabacterium sp. A7-Y]